VPADWPGFTIRYRYRDTPYEIRVDAQPDREATPQVTVDGIAQKAGNVVTLVDDGTPHVVHVAWLGATAARDVAATLKS
jgi:cyclic beta-1,2-glucan synthetase